MRTRAVCRSCRPAKRCSAPGIRSTSSRRAVRPGRRRALTLTHRNILENARSVGAILGYTARDRVCIPLPLYHCFGMGIGTLGCVAAGATMAYPAHATLSGNVLGKAQVSKRESLQRPPRQTTRSITITRSPSGLRTLISSPSNAPRSALPSGASVVTVTIVSSPCSSLSPPPDGTTR